MRRRVFSLLDVNVKQQREREGDQETNDDEDPNPPDAVRWARGQGTVVSGAAFVVHALNSFVAACCKRFANRSLRSSARARAWNQYLIAALRPD
jgi:hypothetical protein